MDEFEQKLQRMSEAEIYEKESKQDLVFSVKLHFGLTLYPLSLIPYPLSIIPYPLSSQPLVLGLRLEFDNILLFSLTLPPSGNFPQIFASIFLTPPVCAFADLSEDLS